MRRLTLALFLLTSVVGGIVLLASGALPAAADPGTTKRVSVDSSGNQADHASASSFVSTDGRYVAFMSYATNLVLGDTNLAYDIFVHDRRTGDTERVSVDSSGNEANGDSFYPVMSADGRYVVFHSVATNLVPDDNNGITDVFVHDRQTEITERVSVDSSGIEGNSTSHDPGVSADGRYVVFHSYAFNLVPGDTNGEEDVFVRDRQSGTTERVSVDSEGNQGNDDSGFTSSVGISADGRYVVFVSEATNLVPSDTNTCGDWIFPGQCPDVFIHDRQTSTTERVSVDTSGTQADGESSDPAISADGRYVAFSSDATNLVPGDTNGEEDVFLHDRQSGTTERVSVDSSGSEGDGRSCCPAVSADGRYVAFSSGASNLVLGDANVHYDVFVHDRRTEVTERVSVDSSGNEGNHQSGLDSLSADGRYVSFHSYASNLVPDDTNTCGAYTDPGRCPDVFVHDRWAPAELATAVVGADYLWEGKGWDYNEGTFVESQTIRDGYLYCSSRPDGTCDWLFDDGLDCAGLVYWAYNKAARATSQFDGPIPAYLGTGIEQAWTTGAKAQFDYCFREEVAEQDLLPGDLLFFEGNPWHVVMCVGPGDSCADVVHADHPDTGIVRESREDVKSRLEENGMVFKGYRTYSGCPRGIGFTSESPVDLIVTDPDGYTITKDVHEVPGHLYYLEFDVEADGDPHDIVTGLERKMGDYSIAVIPEPDAAPTDTYSLVVEADDETLVLAQDIPISAIPSAGYAVESTETGISQVFPAVGGIAELPDVAGSSAPNYVALAALAAAALAALSAGAWYARRRWLG